MMNARTIQQSCNDMQYRDNTKDGVSMNERTFIAFVKGLIREYAEKAGQSLFISIDSLPFTVQQEYLKQWYFFEGYMEEYQAIFNNPQKIKAAIQAERDELNHWLSFYTEEVEQENMSNFMEEHGLVGIQCWDNGETIIVRR